ncbi:MAG: diol dehydratase small subunit [Propionibacteriaceae bacterium]|nr:diol dehydratase small subunit [Propionibacteriaceae bacterium]
MDQEQLIRQIMAEVMANLGKDSVAFQKKSPAAAGTIGRDQYPLGEKMPEKVFSATGKKLSDFSLEKLKNGELTADDFRIAPETLEMQAQVAESVDRDSLARNMRRAAELIAVPDDQLLSVYNALRPYRSTKAELYGIADELEQKYKCKVNAAFIREAADVYEKRGRLKAE